MKFVAATVDPSYLSVHAFSQFFRLGDRLMVVVVFIGTQI